MTTVGPWVFSLCYFLLQITSSSARIEQIEAQKDGVNRIDKLDKNPYGTWENRRLHTLDIWLDNRIFSQELKETNEFGPNKWYSIQFFMTHEAAMSNENDRNSVVFSFNLHSTVRSTFTYLNFKNEPLGPETVRYEITTSMFDISNASTPVNTSVDYTKTIFKFNATHIMMWTNEILTVKVFLRDIPLDLGDTKFFKFLNFDEGDHDLYKIYYWDPTVFCWTDCYDDDLPDRFHFDREKVDLYSEKDLGETCKIVNCTYDMGEKLVGSSMTPSDFPRCVRLHHTPQGSNKQKTLLKCTNENYTYTACEAFPDRPCWYEVCDNYDLCNSSFSHLPSLPLLLFLSFFLATQLSSVRR